jgi:hypothetical protein
VLLASLLSVAAPRLGHASRIPSPLALWHKLVSRGSRQEAAVIEKTPQRGRLQRLRDAVRETGFNINAGYDYGLPGFGTSADIGLRVTPPDRPDGRKVAGYLQGSISIGGFAKRPILSTDPELRGVETSFSLFGFGLGWENPMLGNRETVPILFGVLSFLASRKGGLGFAVTGLPFLVPHLHSPWLHYPLLRGAASLYVDNPRLARASNRLLDWSDRRKARIALRAAKHSKTIAKVPFAGKRLARRINAAASRSLPSDAREPAAHEVAKR